MSKARASAQLTASSYRSPVEAALSLKSELEAYDGDKDRRSLVGALKEQFLLNRYVAASQAENNRNLALRILLNRMEKMSDNMLLRTIRHLSEIGALDLTVVTRTPTVSIQQEFGLPGGVSQTSLGNRAASNPIKDVGMLLEALEHVADHFQGKATHQIGHSREGG
jgi:hypothetical protein